MDQGLTLTLVTPFSLHNISRKEAKKSLLSMCLGATSNVSISAPAGDKLTQNTPKVLAVYMSQFQCGNEGTLSLPLPCTPSR